MPAIFCIDAATFRLRGRFPKQGSSQVRAFRCVDMGQLWIVSPIKVGAFFLYLICVSYFCDYRLT